MAGRRGDDQIPTPNTAGYPAIQKCDFVGDDIVDNAVVHFGPGFTVLDDLCNNSFRCMVPVYTAGYVTLRNLGIDPRRPDDHLFFLDVHPAERPLWILRRLE